MSGIFSNLDSVVNSAMQGTVSYLHGNIVATVVSLTVASYALNSIMLHGA